MSNLVLKMYSKNKVMRMNIQEKIKKTLSNNKGEGFMNGAVGIIIVIVIGALIMGALYLAFDKVIIPKVNDQIDALFNYKG
ncbi:MAG: DUF6133 family protein [Paraclostridium sp.]